MTRMSDPATPHNSLSAQQWSTVLAVMERLAGSANLEDVLKAIIDSMRTCLHADRASVFQFDPKSKELFISQGHGLAEIRFPITQGLAGEAARTLGMVSVPDCYADPRFNPAIDKKTGYHTRNMLTIPLVSADGGLQGVAQVLNKDSQHGDCFDLQDEQVARALASQAAVAIRRAKLIEAELRKNKIEADLQIARKIQQSAWPKILPVLQGFQLVAASMPADETGGDTFDVICMRTLGGEGGEGKAMILMGDATGHGIGPALSVSQLRAMVRMGARLNSSVNEIVRHLNVQCCEDLPAGRFITAFVGLLDASTGLLHYASAGQAPIVILRSDGAAEELDPSAMPLGIDTEQTLEVVPQIARAPGDSLLLISDGYFEASDPDGDMMGNDRVIEAARAVRHGSADGMLEAINAAANAFTRGHPYDDDRTAIIIKRDK